MKRLCDVRRRVFHDDFLSPGPDRWLPYFSFLSKTSETTAAATSALFRKKFTYALTFFTSENILSPASFSASSWAIRFGAFLMVFRQLKAGESVVSQFALRRNLDHRFDVARFKDHLSSGKKLRDFLFLISHIIYLRISISVFPLLVLKIHTRAKPNLL